MILKVGTRVVVDTDARDMFVGQRGKITYYDSKHQSAYIMFDDPGIQQLNLVNGRYNALGFIFRKYRLRREDGRL